MMNTIKRHLARGARPGNGVGDIRLGPPSWESLEFLPAALEIQYAPPSPIGRAILWTIMALITVSVVWASVGRIDIVATAQGKIIPSGYSKVIQPYETGVIASIQVQDGQIVNKGDVLIELDPTQNQADRDRAFNEYRAARVEAARLQALIAGSFTLGPFRRTAIRNTFVCSNNCCVINWPNIRREWRRRPMSSRSARQRSM